MHSLMRTLLRDVDFNDSHIHFNRNVSKTNIRETDKHYIIRTVCPGRSKSDFNLTLDRDYLTLTHKSEENEEYEYITREYSYSNFKKSWKLPTYIDEEDIRATYESGILEILISKARQNNTKKLIAVS